MSIASAEDVSIQRLSGSWAEQEDDKWTFETHMKTTDLSAPKASDLGPLQLPPVEKEQFTFERTQNERALWAHRPEDDDKDKENAAPAPALVQRPTEHWYQTVLELDNPNHQVHSARYDRLTRAIGSYYEGKESPGPAAYIEINNPPPPSREGERPQPWNRRREYAFNFRNYMAFRDRDRSTVYTHSPLCLVTDIEEAHLIDDIVDGEEEPLLDVYEMKMIADIEQEELDNYTDLDESAREAGADTEMDAEVKRMLVEEAKENVPAYLRLSKGECEELYLEWKSQQNEEAETTANNDAALDDTVDTWEKDTDDEEDSESWSFCPDYNEDEMSFSITRPSTTSSASTDGEELDSNNVTVGDEEQVIIKIVEARDSHDEGYISLSPPFTPTTDTFPKANEKTCFFPTTTRLSVSSFRRQTHAWTESMDSLKAFRATTINEAAVDDALEDDEQTHEAGKLDITEEKSQEISKVDTDNDGPLEAIDHPELGEPFVAPADSASSPTKGEAVEPERVDTNDVSVSATAAATYGRDIATTKYAPLSTVQLGLKPQIRKASLLPTLHSQGTLIYADESHPTGAALNGVLNHAFKFPADSELPLLIDQAHNEIDTDSDGPSKAIDLPTHRYNGPVVAENKPSPDTKHIKNKPSTTDYLAGAVSTGWFYMGIVSWTTVGIVVAGVVVNGLVKLVRRR
jgi:hypothetical protein